MSRPAKQLDWQLVEKMAIAGSPGTEIASVFHIHPETFYDRVKERYGVGFTEFIQSKKNFGKSKIRMKQYDLALEGNTQMLLRLGEVLLDQGKPENNTAVTEDFKAKVSAIKGLDDNDVLQPETSQIPEGSNSED
jgi:hypothetical protein